MTMSTTKTLMPAEQAIALAARLNADPEDDWTFQAFYASLTHAFVEVRDEDNRFLGYL